MLDAVTAAGVPKDIVSTFKRASDTAGSILLDKLTPHLPVEERARLAWEIVERLKARGIDVEKLIDEQESASDELAARRDSNSEVRSIRNVVDDDDPTAGIDPTRYAAHPQTEPLEEDNPTP
ncbi:hypothetical protein CHAN_10475 [Corynebacterium hansenii]|nr:hypothetical protein CHAN_10475 [Corynebacterium hansenii]